jgi:hypothetical protein
MINSKAPIVPGQQAAGIKLGQNIQEVLQGAENIFRAESAIIPGGGDLGITRYRSPDVDLWVKNGVIWQIMVHGDYKGKVLQEVGIGSTASDVRNKLGAILVDMDDLLIEGLPGISFEFETDEDFSPATEIYIFEPDWVQQRAVQKSEDEG